MRVLAAIGRTSGLPPVPPARVPPHKARDECVNPEEIQRRVTSRARTSFLETRGGSREIAVRVDLTGR
jgi:hypothetical protein